MVEVPVHSAWFQPDSADTRERMRVASASSSTESMFKFFSAGVITAFEFNSIIRNPVLTHLWSINYQDDEQAYAFHADLWLTTESNPLPGFEATYDASLFADGGASHMQDPWVGDLLTDITNEITAAVLAGTHPGVPPVDDMAGGSFSVEFEDDEGYPGTVSGRSLDVTFSSLDFAKWDRHGAPRPATNAVFHDALALIAFGRDISDPPFDDPDIGDYATPPLGYGTSGPSGTPPDAWSSSILEARATASTPGSSVISEGAEVLGAVNIDTTQNINIDDAWWEANSWPITRFGSDENTGIPLMLSPEWLMGGSVPYDFESETAGVGAATIWMNATWTPPRYRIVYSLESTVIPPRRIFQRSDGLTHGARRVGSGNTRQSGSRTLGAIL